MYKMFTLCQFRLTFVLLLFICTQLLRTTALQCYSCQNCDDDEDLQMLNICGELPIDLTEKNPLTTNQAEFITETSTTPITTYETRFDTTAMPTTKEMLETTTTTEGLTTTTNETTSKMDEDNNDNPIVTTITKQTDDGSDYNNEVVTTSEMIPTTTQFTDGYNYNSPDDNNQVATTTMAVLSTTKQNEEESDYNNEVIPTQGMAEAEYSLNEENFDYVQRISKRGEELIVAQPFCYMTSFMVNGKVVINRGCIELINNNEQDTCAFLQNGTSTEQRGCRLCHENGCNKLFVDIAPTQNLASKMHNFVIMPIIIFIAINF